LGFSSYVCNIKRNLGKIERGSQLGELPKIWGFPYITSATAEASDFKLGTQLRFARAHRKHTPKEKRHGHGLGEIQNIYNFSNNLKFGVQLGFAMIHHKKHNQRKSGH